MADTEDAIKTALRAVGLGALIQKFEEEKIDINVFRSLTDSDLSRLGVQTMGDRVHLRAQVMSLNSISESGSSSGSTSRSGPATMGNRLPNAFIERALSGAQFGPTRSRFSNSSRREQRSKSRTWTGKFVCLSDKDKIKPPNVEEKGILQNAGLGQKNVQFQFTDTEHSVMERLMVEYPLLKDCGGFELLRCGSSCRQLQLITGRWGVKSLRETVGSQAKIYIRPIQTNITLPITQNQQNEVTNVCMRCNTSVNVLRLRQHIEECAGENLQTMDTTEADQSIVQSSGEGSLSAAVQSHVIPEVLDTSILRTIQDISEDIFQSTSVEVPDLQRWPLEIPDTHLLENPSVETPQSHEQREDDIQLIISECINGITEMQLTEPIECLRYIQSKVLMGRKLDLQAEDLTSGMGVSADSQTNYITVDRDEVLKTGLAEIGSLQNLRLTLEVEFYGETAQDYGGPRREFFSAIIPEMKTKYFDPLRNWGDLEDYETIGKVVALAILQNGKLPRIFDPDTLEELLGPNPRNILQAVGKGMDSLGMLQLIKAHPLLAHLITPTNAPAATLKSVTNLLKADFAEQGSNIRRVQTLVYQKFVKYLREVAAGRRGGLTLGMVMKFVTGMEGEPPLGFGIAPSLSFRQADSMVPTANTCANTLVLPLPRDTLPEDEELFRLYDYAFYNDYFGLA